MKINWKSLIRTIVIRNEMELISFVTNQPDLSDEASQNQISVDENSLSEDLEENQVNGSQDSICDD